MMMFRAVGTALLFVGMATPVAMAQAWVALSPQGTPPEGRINNTAVYDEDSQRLIVFGGFKGADATTTQNDVWVLTDANRKGGSRQWIQLFPEGPDYPPKLAAASAVYDQQRKRMIVYGGQYHPPDAVDANLWVSYGGVWVLENADGTGRNPPKWKELKPPCGSLPPARQNHQAVYDAESNRMIVFGGLHNPGAPDSCDPGSVLYSSIANTSFTELTALGDVWILSGANGEGVPAWQRLTTGEGTPSPRHGFVAVYEQRTKRMMVFGGCTASVWSCQGSETSELRILALLGQNGKGAADWSGAQWVNGANFNTCASAPCWQFASAGYDGSSNRLFLVGGRIGDTNPNGSPLGLFTDTTWVITNVNGLAGTPQFSRVGAGKLPSPRGHAVTPSLYDPVMNRFIVFGGPLVNDAWTLNTR